MKIKYLDESDTIRRVIVENDWPTKMFIHNPELGVHVLVVKGKEVFRDSSALGLEIRLESIISAFLHYQ